MLLWTVNENYNIELISTTNKRNQPVKTRKFKKMDKKDSISLIQKFGEYLEKNKIGCKVPKKEPKLL
jgi:hypothetical protein